MSRIARIVVEGYPHHIIQRGNNRQLVFFDREDRKLYLNLLKKYSSECKCKILAYCLMNNHIHILAIPDQSSSLAKTMQKLSLTYTQYFNKKCRRTGRLWECRFYSAVVEKESYLLSVCRYIEQNPIRANIVNNPIDYEWSSARTNCTETKDSFIEPIWKEYVDKYEYKKFLDKRIEECDIENIRKSTFSGMPIGTNDFLDQLAVRFGNITKKRPKGRPRKAEK